MVARQGGALRSSFSLSRCAILANLRQDRSTRNRRMDFGGQTKCSFSASGAQIHLDPDAARRLKMGSGVWCIRASVSQRRSTIGLYVRSLAPLGMTRMEGELLRALSAFCKSAWRRRNSALQWVTTQANQWYF